MSRIGDRIGIPEGFSLMDLIQPLVVGAFVLALALTWREAESKQEGLVVVDYQRLGNLYSGHAIERGVPAADIAASTDDYLALAHAVADDFAATTGRVVILKEAIVGGAGSLPDVTDLIHERALHALEEPRR